MKTVVFSTSFGLGYLTIKANLVAKIMQSAYLCVIYHVKHKKNHHFLGFKPGSQFFSTQRQFSENIYSEGDLRSIIFGTFVVKFLACLIACLY